MCVQKEEATTKIDVLIAAIHQLQKSIDELVNRLPSQSGN